MKPQLLQNIVKSNRLKIKEIACIINDLQKIGLTVSHTLQPWIRILEETKITTCTVSVSFNSKNSFYEVAGR